MDYDDYFPNGNGEEGGSPDFEDWLMYNVLGRLSNAEDRDVIRAARAALYQAWDEVFNPL